MCRENKENVGTKDIKESIMDLKKESPSRPPHNGEKG